MEKLIKYGSMLMASICCGIVVALIRKGRQMDKQEKKEWTGEDKSKRDERGVMVELDKYICTRPG